MILDQKKATVAYRCPECGMWVTGMVGVFALTADMLRLNCPCGKSDMEIQYGKDKKLRLKVPCFMCPQPHSFTVSSQMFFDRDVFALPCAYSGIDVCYVGSEDAVAEATKKADEEMMELLGDTDASGFAAARGECAENQLISDPQILDIVNFVIRDLDEEGKITCKCPQDEGCYSVEVTGEGIKVRCERCGAKADIPVSSTLSAQAFLNCDHIELQ